MKRKKLPKSKGFYAGDLLFHFTYEAKTWAVIDEFVMFLGERKLIAFDDPEYLIHVLYCHKAGNPKGWVRENVCKKIEN